MENPGEMLRRAAENRRRVAPCVQEAAPQTEAPPEAVHPLPNPRRTSHVHYSALMRSHDRVHTCHLEGQGRD